MPASSPLSRFRDLINPFEEPYAPARYFRPIQSFMHLEAAGGIVLVLATIVAIAWANSPWDQSYHDLWHREFVFDFSILSIEKDLGHLINDGLMAIFFFVVGLEIKRELVHGELASPRRALLPAAAALGGMVVPAGIFLLFNAGGDGSKGWGIPMATDIAFAVGVLALLGKRTPFALKVFILALAIVDDLGAILVIAIFYTESINFGALGYGLLVLLGLAMVRAGGVRSFNMYFFIGGLFWLCIFKSGIHATIAGVILALLTPASPLTEDRDIDERARELLGKMKAAREARDEDAHVLYARQLERLVQGAESPLDRLEGALHPWVSFLIVPLFALANAGLEFNSNTVSDALKSDVSIGIGLGLVVGKLVGVFTATWLVVKTGLAELPTGLQWRHIGGGAALAGIGFTVSLFITGLAFSDAQLVSDAKAGIFAASVFAGIAGYTWLSLAGPGTGPAEPARPSSSH